MKVFCGQGTFEGGFQSLIVSALDMSPVLIDADANDYASQLMHDRLLSLFGPLHYGAKAVLLRLASTPDDIYVVADVAQWLEIGYTANAVKLADWELKPSEHRQIGQPWP